MNDQAIHILVIQPLMEGLAKKIANRFICHNLYQCEDIDSYLKLHGDKIRGVATRGDVGLSSEIMEKLPNLEIISVFGVGTDGIDLVKAAERNIKVTITSDILTADVADLALTFIMALSRDLQYQDKFARSGKWLTTPPRLASKLTGKKIGILGLGKIGKAIAKRAHAFDMDIGYCDSKKISNVDYQYFSNLIDLADFSDFLVLAIPGGDQNKGVINLNILRALGEHGSLINIARGALVNEVDLIEALQSGIIKSAALDVYEDEPKINNAFLPMENVILTPHIASATFETRQEMAKNVFDNLDHYFTTGKAITDLHLH